MPPARFALVARHDSAVASVSQRVHLRIVRARAPEQRLKASDAALGGTSDVLFYDEPLECIPHGDELLTLFWGECDRCVNHDRDRQA